MNVVLADRGSDSDETESTNGLGKTTLLRIIHFCLGSDLAKDRVLKHSALVGVTFGIDIVINGAAHSVSRNTRNSKRVRLPTSLVPEHVVEREDEGGGFCTIDVDEWRCALSEIFIPDAKISGRANAFSPTFRELSHYFIRVGKAAYADPQIAFKQQPADTSRLSLAFLLGLNFSAQRKLQSDIDARTKVDQGLKLLEEASEGDKESSIGDLEAERVVLEAALTEHHRAIDSFNLRDDYHDLERRLGVHDRHLHRLINENHSDRKLLEYYEESAEEEPQEDAAQPLDILQSAGAVFKLELLKSLEEVTAFHKQIYRNRSDFVAGEIKRLKQSIARRTLEIDKASNEKSTLLRVLASSGAIETLVELQRSATELSPKLEALRARIEERKRFDRRKDELTSQISRGRLLLKRDLDERQQVADEAISLFAEYTKYLYGVPGRLGVDVHNRGYRFNFSIDRQGSDGVDQMVVFCFDLLTATLRARRGAKFLTLAHDSSLFADVDPRQYGLALRLAAMTAAVEGFQYICCLNVGALPHGHLNNWKLEPTVRLRLTDDGDSGRLLGRRLPPDDAQRQ
ncbi:DUF2326 domain-containing protein [Roseiterribacter gracilis]|uniref:DUF2326 domain-containing protein n=1 Tax=Roseiterribacter gracilis TaxID=2812848 RepID=A0A8S8XKA5_9PROT|nr:hypothetical protein TMPK1_34570 [Rhodospirillales bacterium TMPK1]